MGYLKYPIDKPITDYIKKVKEIVIKFSEEEFSIAMVAVTGMVKPIHQYWIDENI